MQTSLQQLRLLRRASAAATLMLLATVAWAGAANRLPSGLSRFNPAGLPEEWQYEGVAFNALPSPAPKLGAVPVYRFSHPDKGHLLSPSRDDILRVGYAEDGIAFYAPARSAIPVFGYRTPTGSTFYSTDKRAPGGSGWIPTGIAFFSCDAKCISSVAGKGKKPNVAAPVRRYRHVASKRYLFTAGSESTYQVGAFYFGAFSKSAKRQIEGTARVHARREDWWGGVIDFYGRERGIRQDTRGWGGEWIGLKPAIGFYDQSETAVLAKHIRQASDAGLTFFSFYWFWSSASGGEVLPEALASFLRANVDGRLKFNLALYSPPWEEDMLITEANTPAVVSALVGYFANPNYLRTTDGRPVFVMGDHRNIRPAGDKKCSDTSCHVLTVDRFLGALKRASLERLGVEPFVQIQAGAPGWSTASNADGVTCLVPPFKLQSATPYPELEAGVFAPLVNSNKPVSPCMLQNFDERPRQDVLIGDRRIIRFLVGKTDALFRHNLQMTRKLVDDLVAAHAHPSGRIVYLYAWNEWHEGGILEPNAATGAHDLNTVTDVFQLPRSPSRCLEENRCD